MKNPIIALTLILAGLGAQAAFGPGDSPRKFTFTSVFERNPKIWGTYKLKEERLVDWDGELSTLPIRVSDLVISKGHFTFVREVKPDETTKVIVERIPYKKEKEAFKNKETRLMQEGLSRLLTTTLKEKLRLDQREDVLFSEIHCHRIKIGIQCQFTGLVN